MYSQNRHSVLLKHFRFLSSETKRSSFRVGIIGSGPVGSYLSMLLGDQGIDHVIIDKREVPTSHPQAHYINCRSMEIMRERVPSIFARVCETYPPSSYWRDYAYSYSITNRELARVDQFSSDKDFILWNESPSQVMHLPQSSFEHICREEMTKKMSSCTKHYFGYEMKEIKNSPEGTIISAKKSNGDNDLLEFSCDYVVAADGAHSSTRSKLGIEMVGKHQLQTLINVHFRCPGIFAALKPRPAMLYFVFHEVKMIDNV